MNTSSRLPMRIFDLLYGRPSTGKSECSARAIEQYIEENPEKKARIIVGDGSLITYEHLLLDGRAEGMEFSHRDYPTKTLRRLAEGWWPADPSDPTSPLVPPNKQEGFLDRGFYVFEGLSVGGRYILGMNKGGMAQRAAMGEKLGPDAVVRYIDGELDPRTGLPKEDDSAFGTNGTAHYMAAQQQLTEIVQASRGLPAHVLWTAHEAVAEQQTNLGDLKNPVKVKTGDTIIGPEVAGKALTPIIQRIFTNTLHTQSLAKKVKAAKPDEFTGTAAMDLDLDYRLWTRDHFAVDGQSQLRYIACTRGVGAQFPQWFSSENPGGALVDFYASLCDIRNSKLRKKES